MCTDCVSVSVNGVSNCTDCVFISTDGVGVCRDGVNSCALSNILVYCEC